MSIHMARYLAWVALGCQVQVGGNIQGQITAKPVRVRPVTHRR